MFVNTLQGKNTPARQRPVLLGMAFLWSMLAMGAVEAADSILNHNFLTIAPSTDPADTDNQSSQPATQANSLQAINLNDTLGAPFIIYVWDQACDSCIQDLQVLNENAAKQDIKVYSLLLAESATPMDTVTTIAQTTEQTAPPALNEPAAPAEIKEQLQELNNLTHLYSPYFGHDQLKTTALPEVMVFNALGEQAASYPDFSTRMGPMTEVFALANELKDPAYAQYTMSASPIKPNTQDGNFFNLEALAAPVDQSKMGPAGFDSLYGSHATSSVPGSPRDIRFMNHDLTLATPSLSGNLSMETGGKAAPNWSGIDVAAVYALDLDQRLLINGHAYSASGFEDQLMAPQADDPENTELSVGYQSYWRNLRYDAGVFFRTLSFRDDVGFTLSGAHMLWQDRLKVALSTRFFNSSREPSTTVNAGEDDQNQQQQLALSYRLNDADRIAFIWRHDALQGIIENPDELVEFGSPGLTGTQYALYPTTRSQNNYILQWIRQNGAAYGYSFFDDTWGREQHQLFSRYEFQYKDWQLANTLSWTHQTDALFFSDLFPVADTQSLLSRSPELAGFDRLSGEFEGMFPLPQQFQLWDKPTFLTLGARLDYYKFETLAESRTAERAPIDSLKFTAAVGINIQL